MAETITAREANQNFSRLLREVATGKEFVITRSGTPIATLAPVPTKPGERVLTPEQQQALDSLIATARSLKVPADVEPGRFNREELYEDRIPRRLRD